MKFYATIRKRLLNNRKVRKAYQDLEPEFAVAQAIIERRIAKGVTQAALARKIGTKKRVMG